MTPLTALSYFSPPPPGGIAPPSRPAQLITDAVLWAWQRPWLLAVGAALLVVVVAAQNLLASWRHRWHAADARLITIAPPPEVDAHNAAALWANLSGTLAPSRRRRLVYGSPHVVWQYTWTGRQLMISVWVPGSVPRGAVEAAIRAAWPGAACTTTDPVAPIPVEAPMATGGHLSPTAADWLPFNTDHDADPLRALMSAGSQLKPDEHACVQILARPASSRRVARARKAAGRLRAGKTAMPTINPAAPVQEMVDIFLPGRFGTTSGKSHTPPPASRRDPGVERDVRAILDKTAYPLWQTGIRYAVARTPTRAPDGLSDGRLRGIADTLGSAFAVYTGRNRLTHRTRMRQPVAVLAARRLGPGFLTSSPELAALAALPQDLAVPGLDRARAKSMPAPVAIPTGGRGTKILGDAEIGGHSVALSVVDARYHTHVIGSTGSGKTTLLVNMAVDDILAGRGTVVIDPHGDMMAAAGVAPDQVDLVVLAMADVPEYLYWDAAAATQAKIGALSAEAVLVNQACSSGVAAFDVVAGKFSTHPDYRVALLVAANRVPEAYWNRMDSSTAITSDGAAAAVLVRGHGARRWLATEVITDGRYVDSARLDVGGAAQPFALDGPGPGRMGHPVDLMKAFLGNDLRATIRFVRYNRERNNEVLQRACTSAGVRLDEIGHILHMNGGVKAMADYAAHCGIPLDRTNAELALDHGHFGSADQLLAFAMMHAEGRFRAGDLVALTSTGNGMHWACTLLRV